MPARRVVKVVRGQETSDGAGVRLRRSLGGPGLESVDPFLLLRRVQVGPARPTGEPVARSGPFVMNTREEIQQAFRDFREGRLA